MVSDAKEPSSLPLNKDIVLDDIEESSSEEKYIAIHRKAHPELEKEEKKLEEQAEKKINSFKPTKIIGFNSARVDVLFKDDKGRTIAYQQWQKRKPNREFIKLTPKAKRNPDKLILSSVGKYPDGRQVFTYKNNSDYVYIAHGIDLIRYDMDDYMFSLLQQMGSAITNPELMEKLINADFRLQYMSKSTIPHLKLKDWSKERQFIHINPQDLDKQFEGEIQKKKDERDKLR